MNWTKAGLVLLLILSLGLTACGQSQSEQVMTLATPAAVSPTASNPGATAATTKTPRAIAGPTPTKNPNQPAERAATNYTAPNFTLKTVEDEEVSLSQFRGKPVLLNFWATWCGPCKAELPLLQQTHETYKDRLEIVGVDVKEPGSLVRLKITEVGMTYTNLLDGSGKITNELYRVNAYPTSFFIDKDGVIKAIVPGALAPENIEPMLNRILQ